MKEKLNIPPYKNKDLFVSFAFAAACEIANKFGIFSPYKVVISEKTPSDRTKKLIMDFIFDFDSLCIAAEDSAAAENICNEIMNETGAYVTFARYAKITSRTVLVDIDRCEIRIGRDACAKKFEPVGENYGYNIDLAELFEIQMKDVSVKTCLLGKNKLTLQM